MVVALHANQVESHLLAKAIFRKEKLFLLGKSRIKPKIATCVFNDANQRTKSTLADGSYWDFTYDDLGQVTSASKKLSGGATLTGEQFGYSFDTIGNRTSTTANGQTATYTPNLLNQYDSRTVPGVIDVLGKSTLNAHVTLNNASVNRQGEYFNKQLTIANTSSAFYGSNWVVAVTNNVAAVSGQDVVTEEDGHVFVAKTPEVFTYDNDGNLTSDGRWDYTWDAENRLIQMETTTAAATVAPKQKLEFTYDYYGRRIQKKVYLWNGSSYDLTSTSKCIYDGWNKIADVDGSGNLVQSYVWGNDLSGSSQGAGGVGGLLMIYNQADTSTHFVGMDANGNVSALVNAADGIVSAEYEYSPFGETLRASGTMADVNPFRFSTKYQDDESGFLYYGYRYYNPSTGRWLGREPLEEEGSENLYAYVRNDGVRYADYLGLALMELTGDAPPTQQSFGSSLWPVYGSLRDFEYQTYQGNYGWSAFYGVMAVSDVFLVRSIATGLGKGCWKVGSHTWGATKAWYKQIIQLEKNQHVHHQFFSRNEGIGRIFKGWGEWLINQRWNLNPIKSRVINGRFYSSETVHFAIHGDSKILKLGLFQRWNYGFSAGAKAFQISGGMRFVSSTTFQKIGDGGNDNHITFYDDNGHTLTVDAQSGQIIGGGAESQQPFDKIFSVPQMDTLDSRSTTPQSAPTPMFPVPQMDTLGNAH